MTGLTSRTSFTSSSLRACLFIACGLSLAACASRKPAPPPPPPPPVVEPAPLVVEIALTIPTQGEAAALGRDLDAGATLAVDDINARAERVGGARLELRLVRHDEGTSLGESATVAQRIAESPALAVIGHSNLTHSAMAIPAYRRGGLPLLAPVVTHPRLTDISDGHVLRMLASDADAARQLGAYASASLKLKRIVLVTESADQGTLLGEQMMEGLCGGGCEILHKAALRGETPDLRGVVQTIRRTKPDAVLFGGSADSTRALLRQLQANKLSPALLSSAMVCTRELPKELGGLRLPLYCYRSERDAPADFRARLAQRSKPEQANDFRYAAYAYDAVGMVVEALKQAELSGSAAVDRKAVLAALQKTKHAGVMGPVAFFGNGDPRAAETAVYGYRNGELQQVAVVAKELSTVDAMRVAPVLR